MKIKSEFDLLGPEEALISQSKEVANPEINKNIQLQFNEKRVIGKKEQ